MDKHILGIHHVTMIAGEPQHNLDFYMGVLGLRLVKRTVNYDDPSTYHLYYGDALGNPGTLLTFFPWPGGSRGRQGTGQTTSVALSIPTHSLGYWMERLIVHGIDYRGPNKRFGDQVLSLKDRDGLSVELVADRKGDDRIGWIDGPVPSVHAIRGVHSVTLMEEDREITAQLLTGTMGFRLVGEEGSRFRYEVGDGEPGALVDVVSAPGFWRGAVAVGTVHHIAWRTPDDEQHAEWHKELLSEGYAVHAHYGSQLFPLDLLPGAWRGAV